MNFVEIERDYIRSRILPDFEWMSYTRPTDHHPLEKPIDQCRVALITTSGAYLRGSQKPFSTTNKLGDDSFRIIPNDIDPKEVALAHPGYDTKRAMKDLDCVFPLALLNKLQGQGSIREAGPRHFSFMGYIPFPERLISERAPSVGEALLDDGVYLVILVPS
ncbi:MAG: glycine/sarcosine/betaine reductase selenoprotein B family protein [bacterium]